ncbi:hypothetical protein Ngar_c33510 [Candidatus Nitrososphaera gargensis Ga9.2]|uniref:Uncharacterized protein n=1 Tax=Nitrososphaera gargensis (strain Ga9.2) TaxID=1237085 RepID=K0IFU7_NITGG|nr:hypothetical protein Ngar_c33510 [Candidatus Nitrososphaera gargensis Ga9.2]
MQSQLLQEYRSSAGLTDNSGLILYASNQSLIGSYYHDDKFQSILPGPVRSQFNALLDMAVAGESGIEDVRYLGSNYDSVPACNSKRQAPVDGIHHLPSRTHNRCRLPARAAKEL